MGKFLPRENVETQYTKIDRELLKIKMEILDLYPSQAALVNALKMLIDKKKLKKRGEPYRLQPQYDYTKRPVDEALGYEVNMKHPTSFDDWREAVSAFLQKLPVRDNGG